MHPAASRTISAPNGHQIKSTKSQLKLELKNRFSMYRAGQFFTKNGQNGLKRMGEIALRIYSGLRGVRLGGQRGEVSRMDPAIANSL
jgi:hypothetical protein